MTKSKEELEHMGRPMTAKSDRLRAGYGSILMQVPSNGCPHRPCIRKAGHEGEHWPSKES